MICSTRTIRSWAPWLLGALALLGWSAAKVPGQETPAEAAPAPVVEGPPAVTCMEQLVCMCEGELLTLYRQGKVGAIPEGYVPGRAIFWPGTAKAGTSSDIIHKVWKGKVFYGCQGIMLNKLVCGIEANPARVFYGDSWLDGGRSIIMDYCGASRFSERIRDEIREVAPGIFLGISYRRQCPCPRIRNYFALQQPCCTGCTPAP